MVTDPISSLSTNPRAGLTDRFSSAWRTVFQFWKFTCVGALATFIQFAILILLVQRFGSDPVVASVTGYLVSICFNYYLNYKITFKARSAHGKTALMFGLTAATGLLLNAAVMSFCLRVLSLKYILSQVAATGFVFVWNFTVNKFWTFRAAGREAASETESFKENGKCRK
jgi:putative flippase GtrA